MSVRFPGASTVERFWANLCGGVESVRSTGDLPQGRSEPDVAARRHIARRGSLDDIDLFDADYFGFSPLDAAILDPQHRLLLECAHDALESAGHLAGGAAPVGVYAGASTSTFSRLTQGSASTVGAEKISISTEPDFLATLVSYKLDLTGPSLTIRTGCSTSLVAVHLACQALLDYECDVALAGGASIADPGSEGYLYEPGGILSDDGHCRAFDERASGTVPGDGVGVVALRRLDDAVADGDRIHAIIRGSAINNDGLAKAGYTAPSSDAQSAVISAALRAAGVDADTVGCVEAHGTGTRLGDPIELAGLTKTYGAGSARGAPCRIGSVKTNVGHLDAAAGVAGLIKAVLAVEHAVIPPSLHFARPNRELRLEDSVFEVASELVPWPEALSPRRAGVSSFGIGGTNAHVVVEEPPPARSSRPGRDACALNLSARTEEALRAACIRLGDDLEGRSGVDLDDVASTLHVGRRRHGVRTSVVATDVAQATAELRRVAEAGRFVSVERAAPVVFLLPGQGSQFVGMARGPYDHEPEFRDPFELCLDRLEPLLDVDLRRLMLEPALMSDPDACQLLRRTDVAQPALLAMEYSLAQMWQAFGLRPDALLGHSLGELVAACIAGVMTLEEGLRLAVRRGELMMRTDAGGMVAVVLGEADLRDAIGDLELSVAAVNGPQSCVASGGLGPIEELERRLSSGRIAHKRLETSGAFHSASMDPVLNEIETELEGMALQAPVLPYASNVTGDWITAEDARDPRYWREQVRSPVRFADGAACTLAGGAIALELGPGRQLARLIGRLPALRGGVTSIATVPDRAQPSAFPAQLAGAVAALVDRGVELDFHRFYGGSRRRAPLPTYPFERRRHWPVEAAPERRPAATSTPALFAPTWMRALRRDVESPDPRDHRWVVLSRDDRATALVGLLRDRGAEVVHGVTGARPSGDPAAVGFDPEEPAEYERLVGLLPADTGRPIHVVHALGLGSAGREPSPVGVASREVYFSTVHAARAAAQRSTGPGRFDVLSSGAVGVMGDDRVEPEHAVAVGLIPVLALEHPSLHPRLIDVRPDAGDPLGPWDAVVDELTRATPEHLVALRHQDRWVRRFERLETLGDSPGAEPFGPGKVYLVTGAFGTLGRRIACFLARRGARLALLGRSGPSDADRGAVEADCRELGAEVLSLTVDVASVDELAGAIRLIDDRFGALDGVIHAAGVTRAESFETTAQVTRSQADGHFVPKIDGTVALEQVLAGRDLECCVLMSSLASTVGGVGYSAYASANAFLDGFAVSRRGRSGTRWVAVGWDGWAASADAAGSLPNPLSDEDGLAALGRAWTSLEPNVVVTSRDLTTSLDLRSPGRARATSSAIDAAPAGGPSRTSATASRPDGLTGRIQSIFEDLLGLDVVEADGDFFDLGGDSLLAIQATRLISDSAGSAVSLEEFLDARRPDELAVRLESAP